MKKVVIHVGPGKCASSLIQAELSNPVPQMAGRFRYLPVRPQRIHSLDAEALNNSVARELVAQVEEGLSQSDTVVISHEALFSFPAALERIARLTGKLADHVTVIGYSRPQSDFLQSSYCQWLFRSPERNRETRAVLIEMGLDPRYVSGLERQFIAAIETDFHAARQLNGRSIINWRDGYAEIARRLSDIGVRIVAGQIPSAAMPFSVLSDFYQKCGFTDCDTVETERRANPQFDLDLIEAVDMAIMQGMDMPGPHEGNELFAKASRSLHFNSQQDGNFLSDLKSCVDTMFLGSNTEFANAYDLSVEYFEPRKRITKTDIKEIIGKEMDARLANPVGVIERNRLLAAKLMKVLTSEKFAFDNNSVDAQKVVSEPQPPRP